MESRLKALRCIVRISLVQLVQSLGLHGRIEKLDPYSLDFAAFDDSLEVFVRKRGGGAYLHAARLVFDEILKGNADVFVTESAETLVQQRLRPGLCGVNPDKPLQYGEMAYLLPRGDTVTKEYVDQLLHLIKANGEYQRIAGRWLN